MSPVEATSDYVIGRALILLSELDPEDDVTRAAFAAWFGEADPVTRAKQKTREATLEAAKADLSRVRRLAVAGVLTEEEAAAEMPRLREAVRAAERALHEHPGGEKLPVEALKDLQYLAEAWDELDFPAQRRIVEATVRSIEMSRAPYQDARFVGPQRAVIHFVDGSTWPRDGKLRPHPGRAEETLRKQRQCERREARAQ